MPSSYQAPRLDCLCKNDDATWKAARQAAASPGGGCAVNRPAISSRDLSNCCRSDWSLPLAAPTVLCPKPRTAEVRAVAGALALLALPGCL